MDLVANVESFPKPGQSVIGNTFDVFPGGKGANQCVAAARLGADVEMAGMVGNDGYGETLLNMFDGEKVERGNVFVAQTSTSVAVILINAQGENQIAAIPTANYAFGAKELEKVRNAILGAGLILTQLELKLEVVGELIKICKKAGVPAILNPAPAQRLPDEMLKGLDYITPNETELELLTGLHAGTIDSLYAAADALLSKGVKCVIATLGKRGALIADKSGKKIIPGYRVTAVDTVAAGDAFNGALAAALVGGKTIEDAVKFANAAGALAVTKRGAIPSLPRLDEVESLFSISKK